MAFGAGICPDRVDTPDLGRFRALEAQRREWDPDLDGVTPVGDLRGRVPDRVPISRMMAVFHLDVVGLDAERVDHEREAAALVVEGVEVDQHPVVGADLVAVGEVRADLFGSRVEGAEREVDGLVVEVAVDDGAY